MNSCLMAEGPDEAGAGETLNHRRGNPSRQLTATEMTMPTSSPAVNLDRADFAIGALTSQASMSRLGKTEMMIIATNVYVTKKLQQGRCRVVDEHPHKYSNHPLSRKRRLISMQIRVYCFQIGL
ncbi:hypothetical protein CEXT_229451 [Caerostris extrusa]|uniref:Uncharacterized protein n=1 Tax=Caerostris extrusa TaxID=172846 RepID=A0AAV4XD21_CAEEX|nr:hypothetical protein CEXT_229451 [Caerostris extrusa]